MVVQFKYAADQFIYDYISFNHINHMPNDTVTLTNWAIHHGCRFHYLQISIHDEYGGYGLFNSTSTTAPDVDIGRAALFIPNSLIISIELISEAAEESEELADVLNVLPPLQNLEPIITVFLLYQVYLQRRNIPGKWSTYIDHLPKSSLLPIAWNESEVEFPSTIVQQCLSRCPRKTRFPQLNLRDINEVLRMVSINHLERLHPRRIMGIIPYN